MCLLADILDGYFPRQLEKSYPDGILLQVIDQLDQVFDGKHQPATKIGSVHNDKHQDMKPVSKDDFLKQIPEKVISAEGKIIEVRKKIEARLGGNSVDKKKAAKGLKNVKKNEAGDWVVQNEQAGEQTDSGELTVLKVRLDFMGDEHLIIYMPKGAYLAELFRELMKCVPDSSKRYKLVTGFPRRDLDISNTTHNLEDLQLYPKAAIYMIVDH